MRHFRELEGAANGRAALVIGNGPSRMGETIDDARLVTIACNAFWRDGETAFDYLACYDAPQSVAALREGPPGMQIIVPEQREEQVVFAPRSAIELVADLNVDGVAWRFAVSRVAARSFRGLLAGPVGGKLWAGRFELDASGHRRLAGNT